MHNIRLAGCEQHWDLPLADDPERREITMNKIEDRRGRAAHVKVRVALPVPDSLDVQKLPFNAVDQHLPIVAVAGR
jgi:hypothetical protein